MITAVVALRVLAVRVNLNKPWLARAVVYAMGGTAAFWVLDRMRAALGA